ncbi:nuclear pore complex protein [Histomonas meleagridis]|uniref:nuclear pore complex protein n=1 Tax=Histomonas meleagridis TaxID=135588 RepID=UPI00355A3A39|nr:nuclear pore complex protein [Histomonas meleagridis]KAH0801273.1 nuclear pore complex protein [Histomonas meleagridis]
MDQSQIFSDDLIAGRAIQQIVDCATKDNNSLSFFSVVGSNIEPKYYQCSEQEDMYTITENAQFPDEVNYHYASSSKCADIGCLPKIDRFYSILDNKIIFWRTNGIPTYESITVEEETITSVCTIIAPREYYPKSVSSLVVIGTPSFIKLFPIANDRISPEFSDFIQLDFAPLCMDGDFGQFLIGGSDGCIHMCKFMELEKITEGTRLEITNVSTKWYNFLPKLLLLKKKPQITKIIYDSSSEFIGALDEDNRILMFNFNFSQGLQKSEIFIPPKGTKIASISLVPLSDSDEIRLIAFTSKGERLYFGTTKKLFSLVSGIGLRGKRSPPVELSDRIVKDGYYILGFTLFICNDKFVVCRADTFEGSEFIAEIPIDGNGLKINGLPHVYFNQNYFVKYPITWQYLITPPPVYVLTTVGSFKVNLLPPATTIKRIIAQNHGCYDKTVHDWMNCYSSNDESFACCLLISSDDPNSMFISTECEKLLPYKEDSTPKPLTHITHSFFVYVSRLFNLLWGSPCFFTTPITIKVNPIIKTIQIEYIQKLNHILNLIKSYKTTTELTEECSDLLDELISLINLMIELIRFLQIIKSRKISQLIKVAFDQIDKSTYRRLILQPIYSPDSTLSLESALRTFVSKLIEVIPNENDLTNLSAEICTECPHFTLSAEYRLEQAIHDLEMAPNVEEKEQKQLIEQSVATLIHYSEYEINLVLVCSILIQLHQYERAINIVVSRVHSIDENQRGYYWFKNGCDPDDYNGERMFNQIYQCYESVIEIVYTDEGMEAILKCDDEMLHLCIFQRLFNSNEIERLLSIKSPYLRDYLMDNARELLWQYYVSVNDYESAINELLHTLIVSDSDINIEKRIEWIQLAINYSKIINNYKCLEEANYYNDLAKIQKSIYRFTKSDEFATALLSIDELLDKAINLDLWNNVLQIYEIMNFTSLENRDIKIIDAWDHLIFGLDCVSEDEIKLKLGKVFHELKPNSCVLKTSLFIPTFEDFAKSKHFVVNWVPETLIRFGIPKFDIYNGYVEMLRSPICNDLSVKRRNKLIYNALWVLKQGCDGNYDLISDFVKKVTSDESQPYHEEIKFLLSNE